MRLDFRGVLCFPCVCVCPLSHVVTLTLPSVVGKEHSLWQTDTLHGSSLHLRLKVLILRSTDRKRSDPQTPRL